MNLADVMDDLGAALRTIPDLEVFAFIPGNAPTPCAMVGFPSDLEPRALARGLDQVTLPILVIAGGMDDESTRDRLCGYLAGDGPLSVIQAVQQFDADSYDTALVPTISTQPISNGGVDSMAAIFTINIYGKGAA